MNIISNMSIRWAILSGIFVQIMQISLIIYDVRLTVFRIKLLIKNNIFNILYNILRFRSVNIDLSNKNYYL